VRATLKGKPVAPAGVRRYLVGKFGDDPSRLRPAMTEQAQAHRPEVLGAAYPLYEQFRSAGRTLLRSTEFLYRH
jgi:hypothetical protein